MKTTCIKQVVFVSRDSFTELIPLTQRAALPQALSSVSPRPT